jgi:hypothetical protein
LLDVPTEQGLPVRIEHVDHLGVKRSVYQAVKIEEKDLPKDTFSLPKGLKQVQDEMQLLIDEEAFADSGDGDLSAPKKTGGDQSDANEKGVSPSGSRPAGERKGK